MADPHFNDVTLLLPMIGSAGSSIFTDASQYIHQVTPLGGIVLSDAQSKYYETSAEFLGADEGLTASDSSIVTFGTGDFTIEAWIYLTSQSGNPTIFAINNTFFATLFIWNGVANYYSDDVDIYADTDLPLNSWHHVAASRAAGTTRLFVDGALIGEAADSMDITANGVDIGHDGGSDFFSGYMNDCRVTSGIGRYTSPFTPPAGMAFSIAGTITDGAGQPAERTVVAIPRRTDVSQSLITTSSAADGSYRLWVSSAEEHAILALADEATLSNDAIARVIPG